MATLGRSPGFPLSDISFTRRPRLPRVVQDHHAMNDEVRCILDIKARSGETPIWSAEEERLYWVDQERPSLNRFDPASGRNEVWEMPAHASSFALRGAGKPILMALRTGLHDFDPATGAFELRAEPP
jgi:sugar lactone lactonase YvrE